ncbi:hypothetical protein BJY04DRAFT_187821 [Aspergillus karnatakaensis]|uniref:uncharacterized protein n=1 Tax=Aspergillus karnatakaensis TaxID=1810916 RepID=UPI003CCDB78C
MGLIEKLQASMCSSLRDNLLREFANRGPPKLSSTVLTDTNQSLKFTAWSSVMLAASTEAHSTRFSTLTESTSTRTAPTPHLAPSRSTRLDPIGRSLRGAHQATDTGKMHPTPDFPYL